ncbi:MAG: ribonuclease III [Deltaproteobacteria bacterium]|nr:ribonuclease III [Deltaproteobacteria bacterium]
MSWLKSLFKSEIPRDERQRLHAFEGIIGYRFSDLRLLRRALTHKSFSNEKRLPSVEQNERYEFLGDAVLELAVSQLLMDAFPESTEGDLSKLRAAVVNETSLAELARKVRLGDYLYLGRGENQGLGREKDSLLSDAYEAVLGAIFLDRGFGRAFTVVQRQFAELLEAATNQDISRDYKTRLQEESQNRFKAIPQYRLVSETGPDHDKTFEIRLMIGNELFGRGVGKSKKQAEQNAARSALEKIENM